MGTTRHDYSLTRRGTFTGSVGLAATLQGTGVTANAAHPATLINTKTVSPASSKKHDEAIVHVATAPDLVESHVHPGVADCPATFMDGTG
jgi:hypothetical protein